MTKIYKLQRRIAIAYLNKNKRLWSKLQNELVNLEEAKIKAIKQIHKRKSSETSGIDKIVLKGSKGKKVSIDEILIQIQDLKNYEFSAVRRVFIPKKNSKKKRPLGIPTIRDRVVQTLFAMALEPISEIMSDRCSFAYRPYRSAKDACQYIWFLLSRQRGSPRWIFEGDIKGFFDNICHEWILENIPMDKKILSKMLKAGVMNEGSYQDTEEGVPQGGVISPIIANLCLDGLDKTIKKASNNKATLVRYVADFIIVSQNYDILEKLILDVNKFLKIRGLELNMGKSKITKIEDGFDFVGFHFREFSDSTREIGEKKGIFLYKPTKESLQKVKAKIKLCVKEHSQLPLWMLFSKLNPILRGWANYYSSSTAKLAYTRISKYVFDSIHRMIKIKHPKLNAKALKSKFYHKVDNRDWLISTSTEFKRFKKINLFQISDTPIKRTTMIKLDANPYLGEFEEYFNKRSLNMCLNQQTNNIRLKLAKRQKGMCPICKESLNSQYGDILYELEIHHIIPVVSGGQNILKNMTLLHKTCHRDRAALENSDVKMDEPYEG